jgi:hypothetical protein
MGTVVRQATDARPREARKEGTSEVHRPQSVIQRRVHPWLSELDVPEWQELAGGLAGAEEDVEEHHDTNTACVVGAGQKMDRAKDATLTNRGPMHIMGEIFGIELQARTQSPSPSNANAPGSFARARFFLISIYCLYRQALARQDPRPQTPGRRWIMWIASI